MLFIIDETTYYIRKNRNLNIMCVYSICIYMRANINYSLTILYINQLFVEQNTNLKKSILLLQLERRMYVDLDCDLNEH